MRKIKNIAPAIISSNKQELEEKVSSVNFPQLKRIHLDVMDGKFVNNEFLNFDFEPPYSHSSYEIHLMVKEPARWLVDKEKLLESGDLFLIHYSSDSFNKIKAILELLKKKNKKVGLALNPEIKASYLDYLYYTLDQILIMTVDPGQYGSPFLAEVLYKVKKVKEKLEKRKLNILIEVDGGVTNKTIKQCKEAGAELFVSGSYVFKNKYYKPIEALNKLQSLI